MFGLRFLRFVLCKSKHVLFVLLAVLSVIVLFIVSWQIPDNIHIDRVERKHTDSQVSAFLHTSSNHTKKHRNIPVYIVEEHHEVLPYWFGATEKGLIPKMDNVLLHIDGHSDGGPPSVFNIIPLFKFPKNREEITTLMQENDVFITGAVQTGLISRYVWVWPPWDGNLTAEGNDHMQFIVDIGIVEGMSPDQPAPVCACFIALSQPRNAFHNMKHNMCIHLTQDMESSDFDSLEIKRSKCNIKTKNVKVEIVSEEKALELSLADDWLVPGRDSVILDIDEDYYGCEAAVIPLYNVGITKQNIEKLSRFIRKIFCPSLSDHERSFDNIFYYIISRVRAILKLLKEKTTLSKITEIEIMKNETLSIVKSFHQRVKGNGLSQFLCLGRKTNIAVGLLVKLLFKYTQPQLEALSTIGLCMAISTKTYAFDRMAGMRLCDGFNTPDQTSVVFHTPNLQEIETRTANLNRFLQNVPKPSIVTVCRSVRDGYTPIRYFTKIEKDVLETLRRVYNIDSDSIHYDQDLLGGKGGITSRHLV